jgi:prophage antirepressor-like protein
MNALIDLTKCREYLTITLDEKNYTVKLSGTTKYPYFCGKDLCDILDHKDYKYALKTHVPLKYKKELSQFYGQNNQDLGGVFPPQIMVPSNYNLLGKSEITFREGQVVYISEPGLYSLIMGSKTAFSLLFQELVYEQILPSIREYGSYQVESQLTQAMEQLAIKEKSEEDLKREGEELRNKLVRAERKAIRVNKFMKRITIKERKMEWIYIATNDFYALERLWKVGSTIRLSSRIGGYHTGRAKGVGDGYSSFLTFGQKRLRSPAFAGRSTTMCLR